MKVRIGPVCLLALAGGGLSTGKKYYVCRVAPADQYTIHRGQHFTHHTSSVFLVQSLGAKVASLDLDLDPGCRAIVLWCCTGRRWSHAVMINVMLRLFATRPLSDGGEGVVRTCTTQCLKETHKTRVEGRREGGESQQAA